MSIISVFIFAFYNYNNINKFLHGKTRNISIKILSQNISTKNIKKKRSIKNNNNNHNIIQKIIKNNIKKVIVMRKINNINLENKYKSIEKESSSSSGIKLKSVEHNDYELNELVYKDALKMDKRNFYQ